MFLVNLTDTNLSIKANFAIIAKGASKLLAEGEHLEETIQYAISRGWAKLSEDEVTPEVADPVATTSVVGAATGLTFDELQAQLAAKEVVPATTTEAIGTPAPEPTTVPPVAEAPVEKKASGKKADADAAAV